MAAGLAALLVHCGGNSGPATASDGLILVRIVDGSNELVRVRLSDGAERTLTATPGREETWPYWSDVAQRLVFQVSEGGSRSDLVLWSSEGGEQPLTATPVRDERWPAWSPTRTELVFAFRGGRPPAGLIVHDVATGESRLAAGTGDADYLLRPGYAPDGATLVAQRRGSDGRGSQLWRLDASGETTPLTSDPAWFDMKPFFDRTGSRVFFTRRRSARGPGDLASIASRGGPVRIHLSLPEADDHSVRPSPRRDEIAFVSDRDGLPAVYLAPLPDGPARRLTGADRSAFAPRWSPDGEKLVVTATPANAGEPSLSDRAGLARARVVVLDRSGAVLLDVAGFMPSWMAPWP